MDCVWNNTTGFVPRIPIVTCGTTTDTVRCEAHKECGEPSTLIQLAARERCHGECK
jgi:hypothetical protein